MAGLPTARAAKKSAEKILMAAPPTSGERAAIVEYLRMEAAALTWQASKELMDDGVEAPDIDMVIDLIDGYANEIEEGKHLEPYEAN